MSKTYNVAKDCKEESQGGNSEISKLLLPISLQIMFQSKNEIDNKNSKVVLFKGSESFEDRELKL